MSATSPKSFLLISECDFIWQQCHEYWTSTLSQVNCVYQNEKFIFNILPELFSFVQIVKKQQERIIYLLQIQCKNSQLLLRSTYTHVKYKNYL